METSALIVTPVPPVPPNSGTAIAKQEQPSAASRREGQGHTHL